MNSRGLSRNDTGPPRSRGRRVLEVRRPAKLWRSYRCNVLLVLVAACVTTTTRYFMPSTQNPIYRPEQATPVLAEYVRLQCDAYRKASRPDSGEVHLAVDVDSSGFATRAELTKESGDRLLDGVFGTVAAQLVFPKDSTSRPRPRRENIVMDFRCIGDSAVVHIR